MCLIHSQPVKSVCLINSQSSTRRILIFDVFISSLVDHLKQISWDTSGSHRVKLGWHFCLPRCSGIEISVCHIKWFVKTVSLNCKLGPSSSNSAFNLIAYWPFQSHMVDRSAIWKWIQFFNLENLSSQKRYSDTCRTIVRPS